jgi:hypothetical protein
MSTEATVATVPVGIDGLEGWTSCCAAAVTFSETTLCCKACWQEVEMVALGDEQGAALSQIVRDVITEKITASEGVKRQQALLAEEVS